ncbi:hypothetical protein CHITON_0221 [Thermococcus chitonophagus]|uniref:Uncharacterized protein n=1 Tax=Thermococcus chitonophagus TaxID=54262 RepID=A0A160VQL9_9EURY|nr:hypothetical protein CHITON_0221 [Thermococcus chitonophagus]
MTLTQNHGEVELKVTTQEHSFTTSFPATTQGRINSITNSDIHFMMV